MSWHGLLHFVFGQLGFLALIVASFVYARYFAVNNARGWSIFSVLTGALFLFAIFSNIATAGTAGVIWPLLALYAAVILAWLWLSGLALHMRNKLEKS